MKKLIIGNKSDLVERKVVEYSAAKVSFSYIPSCRTFLNAHPS